MSDPMRRQLPGAGPGFAGMLRRAVEATRAAHAEKATGHARPAPTATGQPAPDADLSRNPGQLRGEERSS
jgi:hypothetical protein